MKSHKSRSAPRAQTKKKIIKTTFLDLIGKLLETTQDDAIVVASIRRIFDECNVRMIRSLAPVRLITDKPAAKDIRQAVSALRT
jgi:hypothetical protein